MTVAFYTLGCKVNQYETQAMSQLLTEAGFEVVDAAEDADVCIVNSCTVTAESDRKTRQAVRRFKHMDCAPVVVLTGCMPQAFPEAARELPEADIVLGNAGNARILSAIEEFFARRDRIIDIAPHVNGEDFTGACISGFRERTRAVVKIEDGCDRFCSYCIIPYARGRVRSKDAEELRRELAWLDEARFAEVVLVGINLSAYGTGRGENLADAVEIACSFPNIRRVRLGSLEPDHLSDELIARLASFDKLCPQFHISLQSGCDRTLRAMNRHYTAAEYEQIARSLRRSFPGATLTTDVMVGFPGESDGDFAQSLAFVQKIGFEKVHVFPYSVRPGTRAASMDGQIDRAEKECRARLMSEAAERIRHEFLLSQVGKTVEILVEEYASSDKVKGFTANYTPVEADGKGESLVSVLLTGIGDDCCTGVVTGTGLCE